MQAEAIHGASAEAILGASACTVPPLSTLCVRLLCKRVPEFDSESQRVLGHALAEQETLTPLSVAKQEGGDAAPAFSQCPSAWMPSVVLLRGSPKRAPAS